MAKLSFPDVIKAIFFLLFMAELAMAVSTVTTDQAALLQLKAHINFDPHNFFSHNWSTTNTSDSICNWIGVTCGRRHGRVTALSLPNMGFGGTIAPHVGNLSFLVSLNMNGNEFHGSLPKELWQLRGLKIIDFSSNSISGSLPDDICYSLAELEWFDVSSNEISGQLPSSLGDCRKLKRLSFTFNEITGRIPQNIGNLTELMELFLDDNNLEGVFPPTVFNISSLKLIVLANNSLSGSLPVNLCRRLPSLEKLTFYNNKITGKIPKNIENCTRLNYLNLGENHLTGEIPHGIGKFYSLKFLNIGGNNLTGIVPSVIFNLSSIEVIELHGNHFSGQLPTNIGLNLANLRELYLWGNNLSGIIPSSICNASMVSILELSKNSFSGLIPNAFGNCRQLRILNVATNLLTTVSSSEGQSFYSSLTNCRYLRYLAIQTNPLKGVLPTSIGNLSTSLEYFYAGLCELGGGIPVEIGNFSNMIVLSLFKNELTSTIPTTLGKLQKLQGLDLSYNKLQGFIPYDLCQLVRLNMIILNSNELRGAIPTCFATLNSLRHLYLGSNKFNSSIPPSFWSLRYVLEVDMSLNSLSGSLPLDIGNLEVLTRLNLSGNQLSGHIPSSIGGLKDLIYLSLARNEFQGPIPESFGGLAGLESLDLSGNNLSGEIPKSLEELSHLNYFNVSFNGLDGEIPSGGPFVNLSAESFMQNRALCGSPRLQVPPCEISSIQRSKSKASVIVLRYILPAITTTLVVLVLIIVLIRRSKRNKSMLTENNLLNLATWRRISYQELEQLTDGFSEINLIGTGSFGSVYKATLTDGMNVAIKVFNLRRDGALESFDAECEVLRSIRHRNLVKIISSCSNLGFKAIILQYMPQGSLEKWLYSPYYFLNIQQRLDIMVDVASALEYLHHGSSKPVIHCDLKPGNVLLDDDMVAHLGDFGIAKLLNGVDSFTQTMTPATIGYMAPEYGSEGIVSTSGDVYSFGILLMETFTQRKPTDEMFTGEMSLKQWVKESSPHTVTELVNTNLLSRKEAHFAATKNCITCILGLALQCSAEIPEERMKVQDALINLKKIKTKFLKDVEQA